jgi:hypothetical protein
VKKAKERVRLVAEQAAHACRHVARALARPDGRGEVEEVDGAAPPESQRRSVWRDGKAPRLGDDREVRRLLQLKQEDTAVDGVRRAARDEEYVAGRDAVLDERVEQGARVLLVDPAAKLGPLDWIGEAGPDPTAGGIVGAKDEPGLGLAEARAE